MGVVYSALKEKDEIRLLQLEPGSGSDPIKCSLIHARLGESPTYDALSYMWGEEHATRSYMLQLEGGRALGVRENLGNALRYMRLKDEVRVLWVDAVCINQADDGERGHQVAQMGMIYSQAMTVRVWLGLPDDFTPPAFRFLGNSSMIQQMKLGVTDLSDWKAVAQLCRREYWDRLWIIQEVVLAARIDIHCGERVLEWDQFSKVLFAFEEDIHTFDIPTNRRLRTTIAFNVLASIVDSAAMKICRQRRTNTDSGPVTELSSLLSLLWIHKDAKCVDVRDKIFGLHSFAPACCKRSIPVDYTCSAFTLCHRLLGHDIHCHPHGSHEEGAFRRSLELHELIIGGALKQRGSTNPFQIGCPMPQDLHPLDRGETADSRAASPFKVLGRQCGHVTFVTAPLKSLFVGNESVRVPRTLIQSFQELEFGSEDWENPDLTTSVTQALGLIWRINPTDLECAEGFDTHEDMDTVYLGSLDLNGNISAHGLHVLMAFVSEFLRTSEFLRELPLYEDCVVFLCRSGLIWKLGFAPVGTKIGDTVCTFKDTNIIAIVREIEGQFKIVGQGSRIDILDPAWISWISWTGNLLSIEVDLLTLQAFSKVAPRCELPDYRVVLTMPPRKPVKKLYPLKDFRGLVEALRAPSSRGREIFIPLQGCEAPSTSNISDHDTDPPKYIRHAAGSTASDRHQGRPRYVGQAGRRYACPRCKIAFLNSRDNLRHASTWSHQQCNKCRRWTSWESTVSITSTTPYCIQCRIEDPSCAGSMPDPIIEELRQSRSSSQTDTTVSSTRSSVLDSMTQTTELSSAASTTSDRQSMDFDGIEPGTVARPMPYLHTRKHFCDENCKLFGGSDKKT